MITEKGICASALCSYQKNIYFIGEKIILLNNFHTTHCGVKTFLRLFIVISN